MLIWPFGLSLLLAIGAVTDIRSRRLPNWLSLALFAFGLAFAFTQGGFETLGWHAAHAFLALLVGMALFATGMFGGGDAKFYAGMAAYFTLGFGLNLLLWVSITAIIAIVGWIILRRTIMTSLKEKEGDFAKFPYGVAIAGGGMIAAWLPVIGTAPAAA